ncbi:MAG: aldehyde dehydrogenase family protein [Ilumatobacteraceae bacterium]
MSPGPEIAPLTRLTAGQEIPFGGDRVVRVGAGLAERFEAGDRLVVVQATGALLHIPHDVQTIVDDAVGAVSEGFAALAMCTDDQISDFFDQFATRLADDGCFAAIAAANADDVVTAGQRGRSTTRLVLDDRMRVDMVAGLRGWAASPSRRDSVERRIEHEQWSVEAQRTPLGVVGFVFEGRPNVFADACGVLRTGNTVVFRIGSDALGTARAIVEHALVPALAAAGLPLGAVQLVDSPTHAAGHALFADSRLALAVARGSGAAVAELGAVAAQSGTPVSLHGTGGAWMIAGLGADASTLRAAVEHSLDRKVCNTLNVCVVVRERASELVPAFLDGLDAASATRGEVGRLHVAEGSETHVDRAAATIPCDDLGTEWEWENAPEVSLVVVDTLAEAIELCNRYSPSFVASLISGDTDERATFVAAVDAPFLGNGFTRWVDGQYALNAPELGLSNWQNGRMLGRGAILSGDSVYTVRYRATVTDHDVRR